MKGIPMLRTDVIYRVIQSPTSFFYARSSNGSSFRTHHSTKRAQLIEGDLPVVVISESEFDLASIS